MELHSLTIRAASARTPRASGITELRDVAERLNVPRGTIGYWQHVDRSAARRVVRAQPDADCPRCDGRALDGAAYAYLLGLYLGDGHISLQARAAPPRPIACCRRWPGLIDGCRSRRCARSMSPDNKRHAASAGRAAVNVKVVHASTGPACSLSTAPARSTSAPSSSNPGSRRSSTRIRGNSSAA